MVLPPCALLPARRPAAASPPCLAALDPVLCPCSLPPVCAAGRAAAMPWRVGLGSAAGKLSQKSWERSKQRCKHSHHRLPAAFLRAGSRSRALLLSLADPVLNLIAPITRYRQERKYFTTGKCTSWGYTCIFFLTDCLK